MSIIAVDSYDKLFAKCENIASPTTFLDSALTPKTITANGNAKQLPAKFNKSAGFFNGTTDYVVVPDHADFGFGLDMTLECNINFMSLPADGVYKNIISQYQDGSNAWYFSLYNASGTYYLAFYYIYGGAVIANILKAISTPSINTWYHVAVTVDGSGNGKVWFDGAQQGTTVTSIASMTGITGNVQIGKYNTGAYFDGWMKELRLSNTTRYTGTFTPNTTQFSSDSNTKLLLHFDTPAECPIGASCFIGTASDKIDIASVDLSAIGTGDFTVEWFEFMSAFSTEYYPLKASGGTTGIDIRVTGGNYAVSIGGTTTNQTYGTYPTGRWIHHAFCRSSGTMYAYRNGVLISSVANAGSISLNGTVTFFQKDSSGDDAYVRNFMFSKNAKYPAGTAFTPAQTLASDANTAIWLKFDEANGTTTYIDALSHTVTQTGSTSIKWIEDYRSCIFKDDGNTGHKPYPVGSAKVDFFSIGTGVGYFDGAGDYLTVPDDADWDFGTGDFTIEGYFNWSVVSGNVALIEVNNLSPCLLWSNGGHLYGYIGGGLVSDYAWTPIANTWYHISYCRSGSTVKLFINGVQVDSDSNSTNITGGTDGVHVSYRVGSPDYLNGRLDNIRIAKGVARYTATFDPPFEPSADAAVGNFFLMF
jgi:hypothetical protein